MSSSFGHAPPSSLMVSDLEGWILAAVPDLCAAAQTGDQHRGAVSLRRALAQLRELSPELAAQLSKRIRGNAVRAASLAYSTTPLDRDSNAALVRPVSVEQARPPVLPASLEKMVNELIAEQHSVELLLRNHLEPRWTVLLSGPPGVGKTMLAAWIAHEIGAPLVQLELPSVLSSFLGRTGQNIRKILDYARSNRVVLLLDEFDAIAKRRDDPRDLGELNRIVSVLLKDLEEWSGPSMVIAATNHSDLIDPAIFRRFSTSIEFPFPDRAMALQILESHLGETLSGSIAGLAAQLCAGMSGAKIRLIALSVKRGLLMKRFDSLAEGLVQMLADEVSTPTERARFVALAREHLPKSKASMSKLAALLGVAKSTVHADVALVGSTGPAHDETIHNPR